MDRRALTRQEAAEVYGVSFDTIKKAVNTGAIRAKKVGRRYLIATDELEGWFAGLPDTVAPDDD